MELIRQMIPLEQVAILGQLGDLRQQQFFNDHDPEHCGQIHRNGKTFYRLRIGELRFYFEFQNDGIFCHYILPKHSFEDFCFRCRFPSKAESDVEQAPQFWEFLQNKDQNPF